MEAIELTKDDIFLPNYRGRLTEGISFNKAYNSILWVDIRLAELHRYNLTTSSHDILSLPEGESIGTMGFTSDSDVYIVGTKYGISKADFKAKLITLIKSYPADMSKLRSNDGKVDPWGNLIIGTMTDFPWEDNMIKDGTLYRINKNLDFEVLEKNCFVPNGLGFNSTKDLFYWIDSLTRKVFKYNYNTTTGEFSNKVEFLNLADFCDGVPDGMFVSDKDEMWIATFGSPFVLRFNLQGQLLQKIKIPAKQVTCVTLGGGYLWINTCLLGSTDLKNKAELTTDGDLGGYLFKYKVDDAGEEPQYTFALA